ncbi:MAG TPA: hypothetical protein VNT26_20160 [Candidatus Sulfotelmatobacter sp.]|nr:hypothetical protein [Candidatus Sulfotelmatobacter sp.]
MNKLSKEKRQQLVLVIMLIIGALAGLWFGLISSQNESVRKMADRKDNARRKLLLVKQTIENADQVEAQLGEASKRLTKLESGMASGDLYFWAINTIRQFKLSYKIEIPQFSTIEGPKEVSLLPTFPYKQATISVGGTAYFHDFGRFVADFENQYPYIRVANLTLEPLPTAGASEREKLSFRMDLVMLVKPNAS